MLIASILLCVIIWLLFGVIGYRIDLSILKKYNVADKEISAVFLIFIIMGPLNFASSILFYVKNR